jgi:uncharacterized membrane protein
VSGLKVSLLWLASLFFVAAGANHFINPELYLGIIPPFLPWPEGLNYLSGGAEILGGLGLLWKRSRRFSGWGLIVLLLAVFPANIHVAIQGEMPGLDISPMGLWLRLPFQALFIAWVWWVALRDSGRRQP